MKVTRPNKTVMCGYRLMSFKGGTSVVRKSFNQVSINILQIETVAGSQLADNAGYEPGKLHVHSSGGSTFLCEMTPSLPSLKCVSPYKSMCICVSK